MQLFHFHGSLGIAAMSWNRPVGYFDAKDCQANTLTQEHASPCHDKLKHQVVRPEPILSLHHNGSNGSFVDRIQMDGTGAL